MASSEVVPAEPIKSADMLAILRDEVRQQVLEPEVVAEMISDRILGATSAEAVLSASVMLKGKDFLNVPFQLTDVRWMHSSIEGSTGVYAVVEGVRLDTGEPAAYATGGRNPMTQLYRLVELGAVPIAIVLREADRPSARGFRAQWYEAVPA